VVQGGKPAVEREAEVAPFVKEIEIVFAEQGNIVTNFFLWSSNFAQGKSRVERF
jgi:hypothetical protein